VRKSLAAVAIALCVATAAFALDIPPKPTAWVTDNASILNADQEQALNEKLEALSKDPNGAQFLIMTFPSLEGEDVDDYANRVANQWKVKGDRALILLVFNGEHKIAIRTGYSIEADVTDAISSRVIRQTMAPYFRQGQYYEGLDAAINELGRRIDPNFSPQSRTLPSSAAPRRRGSGSQLAPRDFLFLLFLVFIFLVILAPIMRRTGCRGCGGCFWPMMFLGGGSGRTFGGGGGGGGGWGVGGGWGGGGGSSFGGGGASGGW
jgi:uncharacterized protein